MAMNFEELDDDTRRYMLAEFDLGQANPNHFKSKLLSKDGEADFPEFMRRAINRGNEETLAESLANPALWNPTDSGGHRLNVLQAAERLAITEFNTWYVRGLAKRLLDEGVTN